MDSDLVEFLLARIAEDEGYAREAWIGGRFDERRMLAECDAKRRIIGCAREALSEHQIGTAKWILTLRSLAAPYSDHPDFDPSWRLDSQ